MQTNFRIARIAGISIELHISFLLFVLLFVILDWRLIPMLLILFASITLHELAHSLVGKLNGIHVKRIMLLPIGGMASMDEVQIKPYPEFKMSIAGPLFNYLVCALIALCVQLLGLPFLSWADWNAAISGELAASLAAVTLSSAFWLNWLLGTFNLFIPAIPLDGGRVFRSALAMVTDYISATRIATTVSTVITFMLFIYALLTFNIIMLFIAVFVYLGANAEMEFALSNKLLQHFPLSRLVRRNYLTLPPSTKLDKALEKMIGSRSLTAFTKAGPRLALASLYDIRHVPREKWAKTTLKSIARSVGQVDAHAPLTRVLQAMMQGGIEAVPVIENGKIIGVVFRDDIDRVFEILKVSSA